MSPLLALLRHGETAPGLPLWAEERTCASAARKSESDPKRSFGDALVNNLVGAQEKRLLDRQLHCFRHCNGSVLLKTIKDRGRRELRGTETRGHSRFPSSTP